jgi:YD repeat-containing protein
MGYDALGDRTSFTASGFPTGTNTFNGLTSFAYDARDELTGETSARDGSYSASMIYDGVTMNTTTGPGNPTYERNLSLVYDGKGDNQIASDSGNHAWAYDGDGNPVTYLSNANTFDIESRQTAYAVPMGGGYAILTMGYDGARRLVKVPEGSGIIGYANNPDPRRPHRGHATGFLFCRAARCGVASRLRAASGGGQRRAGGRDVQPDGRCLVGADRSLLASGRLPPRRRARPHHHGDRSALSRALLDGGMAHGVDGQHG